MGQLQANGHIGGCVRATGLLSVVGLLVMVLAGEGCGPSVRQRAGDLIAIKAYDQAVTLLEQETARSPRDATLHRLLGDALFGSAKEREARGPAGSEGGEHEASELRRRADASYATALTLSPKDPVALYHAAVAKAEESLAESRSFLETAIDVSATHSCATFYAWVCRRMGMYFRADSLDSALASHVKLRGEWKSGMDATPSGAGAFIVVADSARVHTLAGAPTSSAPQGAIYAYVRDAPGGEVRFQRPREVPHEGWMLQGEVEAILKDPGLNPFAGGRRQERFIAYSEPTELPPDELANGNWMRMPTVEVDRTGHEFLTDEELRTVRATGEQREVRYAPQGTFLMMHPSLVWGHVGWLETVQEWFAVDTSAVACLPVDKETLEGKVESIKRLRIRDGQLRQNLLKGRIAAGLTLPMVEAALGPLDILAPGWHGDALVQERRSRSAQERLHLRFEDGILTTWKAE